MADQGSQSPPKRPSAMFLATRKKGPSRIGTILFTILRLLDLPLQYYLLHSGLSHRIISSLGGTPVSLPTGPGSLALSPYQSLILLLALGSTAKQLYWLLFINTEVFSAPFATLIAVYNTLLNTLNTLLSLWLLTSNSPSPGHSALHSSLPLGVALYATGLWAEWWCEVQRKAFKADPKNQGKLYTGGFFSLARNINYGGYTLWRVGYGIVCAGLPWGMVMGAWLAGDFINRAIPNLEGYVEGRVSIVVQCICGRWANVRYSMEESSGGNGRRRRGIDFCRGYIEIASS